MKRIALGLLISMIAAQSQAENGFNGSVELSTNSMWRGVSQTLNRPVVTGDFYYETKPGFYLGQTLANVNYGDEDPAFVESTTYIGYSHSFKDDLSIELTASRYTYPAIHSYDYNEYHLAGTYKDFTATTEVTDNYFNGHYGMIYGELAYNHDFKKDISVGGSAGYVMKHDEEGNYWNVKVYGNKRYKEIKFETSLTYTPGRAKDLDNLGGLQAQLTISKDFS